jgi:hypothetical protein
MHFDNEGNLLSEAIVNHLNKLYKGITMNDVNTEQTDKLVPINTAGVATPVYTQSKDQVGDESQEAVVIK